MNEAKVPADQATSASARKGTSFAGDILKLVGGTTVAQGLTVLAAPFLSRLYAPDAFGTAAVFISLASVISVVSCLRYELAIMLPERDEDAANLLAVSLCFVVLITGLSAFLALVARDPILQLLNAPDLTPYLSLVPLAVLADGVFLALNYWNSRTRHFGRLSIAQVSQSVVKNGSQLGIGSTGQTHAGGLIAGQVFGSAVVAAVLGGQIWRDDRHTFIQGIRWPRMLEWAKRHRKFPLFTSWSAWFNTISWQLPSFLLLFFFSPTVVGYYALGYRMLRLPMDLIGRAIAQVFFQRASEAQSMQGNLAEVVAPLFRRLVAFGGFPMLLLTLIGQDAFIVVFGLEWAEAGVYTQILSPWMFFVFISSPLSTLFSVLERQEGGLLMNTLLLTTRFLALGGGGLLGNARLALALFATTGIFIYGGMCIWILRASGVSRSQVFRALSRYLGVSLVVILPVAVVKFLVPTNSLISLLAGTIACGMYGLFLLHEEPNLVRRFTRFASSRS